MTDNPKDWHKPTIIDCEPAYLISREGIVFFTMKTDGRVATQAQVEIAQIVAAWYRGEIFPRSAAPTMTRLFEIEPHTPQPEPIEAIEIAGGVAGLQKLLVEMAKKNRGLDHAALKELYETHELVTAVWESDDKSRGPGFLTLKGTEHLFAQIKRSTRKIRTTMTAIWCNNREHAELLRQAFTNREPSR